MNITVKTPCGEIKGNKHFRYNEWLGVPFAKAGRWEDPCQVTHWDGVFDATQYGDKSMQYWPIYHKVNSATALFYGEMSKGKLKGRVAWSEDSLNLNIFAPKKAHKLPVLVYMHGGAYMTGDTDALYETNGAFAKEGIVSVFITYRLAVFGQAMDEEHSGNYNLKDQIAAIKWVYDNIEAFGGDPERITICGESAGAFSVSNLVATPKLKGIIKGAIMMSGAGDMPAIDIPGKKDVLLQIWQEVKEKAGVKSLDELKDMPAKEIYELWQSIAETKSVFPAGPVPDGEYMIPCSESLEKDLGSDIPVMIGMLSEDMWPSVLYDAAVRYADERAAKNAKPVYLYFLDYPAHPEFGAYHAADCMFAFNALNFSRIEATPGAKHVEDDLFHRFVNFVKYSDPNGEGPKTWLAASEGEDKWYELSGKDHKMFTPDKTKLDEQTAKNIPFPESKNWRG